MDLLIYLLKVSACTVLFFAFYLLVLQKLTFFKINRFYLLLTLLLSFVIPTLNFTIEREVETTPIVYAHSEVDDEGFINEPVPVSSSTETTPIIEESFDYYFLIPYLYFGIVFSFLVIATWRILQLLKHTRNGAERINGLKIVQKSAGFTNCSFFNYVFIDDKLSEAELQVLLKHEEVHAKQFHSIDKIIMMIMKAFLWFNPVVYLYDKALEQAHEYEADEATSQNFGTEQYASLLLRLAIAKSEMPLVHNFVKSPIKDRIKMLFHSKSKNMKKLMYLFALPIGLGLLWGFTVKVVEVSNAITEGDEKTFTLVLDPGHGGNEKGAVVNGISEKDVTLAMAKKIKKLAEAKGIKVVTTRDADENVSIKDRVKANGDILISLHVNSESTANGGKRNGIEIITSGSYSDKNLKLPKSNSIILYLRSELIKITGIKVINQPKYSNVLLLNQSPLPGVVLEMGYLTNKNDFEFITNEIKQDQLAKLIVDGIFVYKDKLPASEERIAKFKKLNDEFQVKYEAWKNSDKYTKLVNETKNFKAQTLVGKIEELNYVKFGGKQTLDGFILNANNKFYRIYIGREKVKSLKFKVNDEVKLYAPKAEVWFDSDYPAINPQKLTIIESVSVVPNKLDAKPTSASSNTALQSYYVENNPKPILLRSGSLIVDTKTDISYIKNGVMNIGEKQIEAEEIAYDKRNEKLTAKNGKLKLEDGSLVNEQYIVYDLKKNTYITNSTPGNKIHVNSLGAEFLTNLKALNSSLHLVNIFGQARMLTGGAVVETDNYILNAKVLEAEPKSNIIKAHLASVKLKDGTKLSGDVIEYDIISKNYKIISPSGSLYRR